MFTHAERPPSNSIAAEEARSGPDWDCSRSSLATIIAIIVERWHRPLEEQLPEVQALADALARVEPRAPFLELAGVVAALRDDLGPHMLFEECVVFPMILDGEGSLALSRTLRAQSQEAYIAELLTRIRALTDGFELGPDASALQRRLWAALEALERDLTEHVACESNVLIPRALAGENPLCAPRAPRSGGG